MKRRLEEYFMEKKSKILWEPKEKAIATSQIMQFLQFVNQHYQRNCQNYFDLQAWSVNHPEEFWQAIWLYMEIIAAHQPKKIFISKEKMQDSQWFPGAKLNFAENLLRYRDESPALIFRSELGVKQTLSYQDLFQQVKALAAWLSQQGLRAGDRVAGIMPNCPETVVAMLATTSLGGVWSACSPDFGFEGILNRFEQIQPKILIATSGHSYGGKIFNHLENIRELQNRLSGLQHTIVTPFADFADNLSELSSPVSVWADCLHDPAPDFNFTSLPFDHPLYILYSSGTTGKPKCMVHGAGRVLLQHLKELRLHTDLRRGDRIFFFSTCAWMMWHWLISSLAVGATIILYEGNPFFPKKTTLFDLIDECGINIFGVGAKVIESAEAFNLHPEKSHSLSSLRTILTTGSPLLPKSFDYVYQKIKIDVHLSSISGGSDIISCFGLGNPMLPVYRGEIQCLGLGMNVKIFNEQGQSVIEEKGELVCTTPFPSMPVYFWNDVDGEKYQQAYFDQFPGVWAHGDYAEITAHQGLIIYGRSDATLNPGGVRIGTAEIYQQIEKFPEIIDYLAVSKWHGGGESIILFIVLRDNLKLTDELIAKLKATIRKNTSPHHTPEKIIQAPDLPRTLNGKLIEIAVKKIINQESFNQPETLLNPESLEFFRTLIKD